MTNPFRRRRIAHPDAPSIMAMHQGDSIFPGTGSYVLDFRKGNPIVMTKGPGQFAGSLAITQPPGVVQNIALMTEAQQGIPVASMDFEAMAQEPVQ